MVSDLNKLADLVQLDSLPSWMRQEIELRRDEILQKLRAQGFFVLQGPNGERVTIRSNAKTAAAA